ncbi:uncharacterized protein LOC126661972 [Mercurialis annua]|uniref:uncharacterized protein LOC126661972 n=1 Tax=Mercurialis annua TaxID=3986 RepID=UPI002160AB80|nr:uncharacterized protein LOC126661972 [Mercurialis annua]
MYQIVRKLQAIKFRLRELNKNNFSDISLRVKKQRDRLDILQRDLQFDPLNQYLISEEKAMTIHMRFLLHCEESFFKQKSKIDWLKLGDANTRYFHNSVKQRTAINSIHVLSYFNNSEDQRKHINYDTFKQGNNITVEEGESLMKNVTETEVKEVVFSIGSDKAAGPDGPIACCNVLYKIVTKVITKRLSPILMNIVSSKYSTFIPRRFIAHNIMLARELVTNYHRNTGSPRCLLKIDLKKAYDSISWDFIEEMLIGLKFPSKFIFSYYGLCENS